jgi:hypothetical protein
MMNEELKNIFGESIKVGSAAIPTAHLKYKGGKTTYVVWTIIRNAPALSGDDEPLYSIATVDVDIYSKGNYLSVLAEVKRLMKINGWIWTEDSPEMYEDDTGLYHITASFEKERII